MEFLKQFVRLQVATQKLASVESGILHHQRPRVKKYTRR